MLQWMGGSRRKLTTSRKSTQNRQKQYFEQRKRQQQHEQQTTGVESYADGINISGQHHKESRSLDILSLLNLSAVAQEHKSACANGREDLEVNASRMKCGITKDPLTIPSKMVAPPNSVAFSKARAESVFQVETASPKKVIFSAPDNHKKSFNEINPKPDNWGTATEQQYSLPDFFGDDGMNDYVEGSPVREAHVAFSVEGLGKVGMETPVHSPKRPGRTFSYDCSSPLNAARQQNSFKNHKHLDDLEVEVDAMMQDINMPLSSSALEFSTDLRDSFSNSKKKLSTFRDCSQYDGRHSSKLDSCNGRRRIFDNAEYSSKDKWDGTSTFPDENSVDEWKHDLSWKNWPGQMNCGSVDNLMHRTHEMRDFSFEGPFSPMRFDTKTADKFNIIESPSFSKHQISENDHDFVISSGARPHTVGRNFDFGGVTSQPDWSCFVTEYERDNVSLLSEESCSSSAVRVNATENSLSKSSRKQSKRSHGNAYAGPEYKYHVNMTSTKKTHDKRRDVVLPGNIAHGSGKCTNMSNSSKLTPSHHSNSRFLEKLTPSGKCLSEEQYMPVDINSGSSSFLQNSETNCPSEGSEPLSGEPFGAIPVPELHFDPRSLFKQCEPVASSPSGSFISEKFAFQDSPLTSKIGFGPTKPDFFPYSHCKTPSPASSAQESVSKDEGRKGKFQPSEKSKLEEENCLLNDTLFTENKVAIGALTSKNKNGECKEAKYAAPVWKKSVKPSYFPDLAEETSSTLKSPDKFKSIIVEKERVSVVARAHHDSEIPLPCQNWSNETGPQESKEESKQQSDVVDSSCQVMMLQSYVLQFLCVQKVLKEAASHNGMKKI